MSDEDKDKRASETRMRGMVEDATDAVAQCLIIWKRNGRVSPFTEAESAMIIGNEVHVLLSDGSRGKIDISTYPFKCFHIPA